MADLQETKDHVNVNTNSNINKWKRPNETLAPIGRQISGL